jgi:hypothetical protein
MRIKRDILQEIEEQQLKWCGHIMQMEGCRIAGRIAERNPQGKRRHGIPVSTWKVEIRDSMQSRNLKDEEYLDRELWRERIVFGLRKTVYSQKNSLIIIKSIENRST